MRHRIKRLDFNVAYACNLSCKGCISLSDFDRRGVESLKDIQEQCETWSKILDPSVISIFGGEPLLHPRIEKVLEAIRQSWPNAVIRLITNGYLLRKHDPETWFKFGGLEMQVSVHRHDHEQIITKEIKRIVSCRKDWRITRSMLIGHKQLELHNKDLTIYKSKFKTFVMPYRLESGELKPFRSDRPRHTVYVVRLTRPYCTGTGCTSVHHCPTSWNWTRANTTNTKVLANMVTSRASSITSTNQNQFVPCVLTTETIA